MIPAFIGTAATFIPRYWKLALIAVLLATIAILKLSLAGEQRHATKLQHQLRETIAADDRFKAEVAAKTALASAQDEAHAHRVERDQTLITQETVNAYQREIAALRARAAQRLRSGTSAANPSGRAAAPMPGFPEAAGRPDGATGENGLPEADRLIASEVAVRLRSLQEWVRKQEQVER